jgi:hypothetical protein
MGVNFSVRPTILLNSWECSPLGVNEGVNIHRRGQISPLEAKFTPRGEVHLWGKGVKLRLALRPGLARAMAWAWPIINWLCHCVVNVMYMPLKVEANIFECGCDNHFSRLADFLWEIKGHRWAPPFNPETVFGTFFTEQSINYETLNQITVWFSREIAFFVGQQRRVARW